MTPEELRQEAMIAELKGDSFNVILLQLMADMLEDKEKEKNEKLSSG